MKHVLIFEKEEQALIHQGGLVQVDGKTWIQFEGARRKVKIINEPPAEEQRLLPVPMAKARLEFFCSKCRRGFTSRAGLGIHNKMVHGIKGPHYAESRRRYLAHKAEKARA